MQISLWQKQRHTWTLQLLAFLPFERTVAEVIPLSSHAWVSIPILPFFRGSLLKSLFLVTKITCWVQHFFGEKNEA